MPVWLLSALTLIRGLVAKGAAQIGGARGVAAAGTALALPDPFNIFGGGGGDATGPRRRRRRRALTNSDRDDIAFVAATISKTAAASFAVQLVTRSR